MADIDPKAVNVEPGRKRKKRNRPDPSPVLKAGEQKALARAMKRPLSPGVMLEPEGEEWRVSSPHSDVALWELQIADAFGTRSQAVMRAFLFQLQKLAPKHWDEATQRWKADETEWNAALAMVADIRPRNITEAALAAQMVAVHWMQMRLSAQALNGGGMIMERDAALASKLARTYAAQMETLQTVRGGKKVTRQKITVRKETHQHVHYHRGEEGNGDQSHGRTAAVDDSRKALPSPDKGGDVVPLPRIARS
ncbi:hypothetical protein EKN06_12410 [Croceicoccus ponticola]|uniref:Uncharacterized protein n=1 Tax=Croceicoccus ponticola TaxID=2217664 RepID=A0A437GVE5_9SPHN|nr:hypothetical protein [Croceicoccus ponticola]RVQ65731.1 hypothetical protein EKN06_12410 [Croceicoccus ponticola]